MFWLLGLSYGCTVTLIYIIILLMNDKKSNVTSVHHPRYDWVCGRVKVLNGNYYVIGSPGLW